MADKQHRINNYYKIVDKDTNLVTFKLNRAQAHFLANRGSRNIICKSRQLGFTTFAAVDSADDVFFNPNIYALILSYDKDSSQTIFEKVMLAWEHFKIPGYDLKKLYTVDNESANRLKLGFAKICAKYPKKAQEVLSGTIQSVPPSGEVTIESTAEGNSGLYYDMFWTAWNRPAGQKIKPTEFKAFFYNWQWDDRELNRIKDEEIETEFPKEFLKIQEDHNIKVIQHPSRYEYMDDRQLTHYYHLWLGMNKNWELLKQEYPIYVEEAFVGSGAALFDRVIAQQMKDNSTSPIKVINYDWEIYEEAKTGHTYVMGVDPAEGVKRDHSAIVILDMTPSLKHPKVVATYASKFIAPDELAYEIKFAGEMYYFPLVAVERNNSGHATLAILKRNYPEDKIYKEVKDDKFDITETERLGWLTTGNSKPKMFYELKALVNLGSLNCPSEIICHEILTYDKSLLGSTKFDPEASNHFDLLTALTIAYQMKTNIEEDLGEVKTHSPKSDSKENIYRGI